MSIVARGLGLPEDGALVAGGLATSEADLNAMSAALSGSSSLTATLTAAGITSETPADLGGTSRRQRTAVYAAATATLRLGVHSQATGAVSTPTATPVAPEPRPTWEMPPALPADVTATATALLRLQVSSSAIATRTVTTRSATTALAASVQSSATGVITWSVLDDEDELFLLLA